jgi:hypothetical protein
MFVGGVDAVMRRLAGGIGLGEMRGAYACVRNNAPTVFRTVLRKAMVRLG